MDKAIAFAKEEWNYENNVTIFFIIYKNHAFGCVYITILYTLYSIVYTSDRPNSYFQYLRMRISMRIFYFNICECECKWEYYTLIFANANANIYFLLMFITLWHVTLIVEVLDIFWNRRGTWF